jgi:hypothetical protein
MTSPSWMVPSLRDPAAWAVTGRELVTFDQGHLLGEACQDAHSAPGVSRTFRAAYHIPPARYRVLYKEEVTS